jgi:hypothetical protein
MTALFDKGRDAAFEALERLAKRFETLRRSEETRCTRERDKHRKGEPCFVMWNQYLNAYCEALGYAHQCVEAELQQLRTAREHDHDARNSQSVLFTGLSCLPGQADLFDEGLSGRFLYNGSRRGQSGPQPADLVHASEIGP